MNDDTTFRAAAGAGEEWVHAELRALADKQLLRQARTAAELLGHAAQRPDGGPVLNFSSNDYLGLARHPDVVAAACEAARNWGAGAGASRLVSGTLELHQDLERRLAVHKNYAAALLFGSGFLANLGVVSAIVGPGDTVFADRLVHASLVDAVRLSGAELRRFRHNDSGHLENLLRKEGQTPGRRLVVTESVFSMDGDAAPLPELCAAARAAGALVLVDEAHATGVFGPGGAGLVAMHRLEGDVNLAVGTLSKALGAYGGFVACSGALRELLVNRARPFIYSTALPPPAVGAARAALEWVQAHPDAGRELLARATVFRERLTAAGLDTGVSSSQIVPVMIGDNGQALRVAQCLREQGVLAVAIRPPTVPVGTARIRFSLSLAHSEADLEYAAAVVVRAVREGAVA
ncbi:MAG: 8-amino-7-oxononanoate synthase [Lentisphaerae bacterium RIFOXYB12_FULL_65_16]|nr:MAG: 8-amino-7-oxononanoate synthase [Lentisphaerae bacterium RIFOXYA12_64_32]OGV89502.1 MAG: 8-amino-7-oxononanoate synthase [Lentisphaerae bacterium RIFOXYB12_FULL_65_16]